MGKVISLLQKKGGAAKTTTAINLLGALLEAGKKVILCDMDKDKPDAIYWADNGDSLVNKVIPLVEYNPKKKIEELKKKYDFIIIDTPPNFEASALKAALLCDLAIIPCVASLLDKKGLEDASSCAIMADKPYKFLASRITKNTRLTKQFLSQIEETNKGFNAFISNNVAMVEAQSEGKWVGNYKPESQGHIQYRELVKELLLIMGEN